MSRWCNFRFREKKDYIHWISWIVNEWKLNVEQSNNNKVESSPQSVHFGPWVFVRVRVRASKAWLRCLYKRFISIISSLRSIISHKSSRSEHRSDQQLLSGAWSPNKSSKHNRKHSRSKSPTLSYHMMKISQTTSKQIANNKTV